MTATTPRPTPLVPILENIPAELREGKQSVTWRYTWKPKLEKWDKPPMSPTGGKKKGQPGSGHGGFASVTDPDTWTSFDLAVGYYRHAHMDGVGRVLTQEDGLVGIDMDHVLDEAGGLTAKARAVVERFPNTYWEWSPSGEGLHGFVKGMIPSSAKPEGAGIELYAQRRFLTLTGHRLEGTGPNILDYSEEILRLHGELKPPREARRPAALSSGPPPLNRLSDEAVIRMAKQEKNGTRFTRLWEHGDWSGFTSASNGDWHIIWRLLFYTGPDPERLDRLYRQSAMYHLPDRMEKWDDPRGDRTYGQLTIAHAIEERTEYWSPHEWSLADSVGEAGSNAPVTNEVPEPDEAPTCRTDTSCSPACQAEIDRLRQQLAAAEQRNAVLQQQLADIGERFAAVRAVVFSGWSGKRAAVALATVEVIQEQFTKGAKPGDEWEIPNSWVAKRAGCSANQAGDYLREFADAEIIQREPVRKLGQVQEVDRTTGEIRTVTKKIWHSIFTLPDASPLELLHRFAGHHSEKSENHGGLHPRLDRCPDHPNADIVVKITRSCQTCGRNLGTVERTLHRHSDDYVKTFPSPYFDLTLAEEANGDSRPCRQLASRENTEEPPLYCVHGGGNLPPENDADRALIPAGKMPAEARRATLPFDDELRTSQPGLSLGGAR
jgi:hypothetical protein